MSVQKDIRFKPLARTEADTKAQELGFERGNIKFKKDDRVCVLDLMAKDRKESERWKYSVAAIESGTVLEVNKGTTSYIIKMDNGGGARANVSAQRMRLLSEYVNEFGRDGADLDHIKVNRWGSFWQSPTPNLVGNERGYNEE